MSCAILAPPEESIGGKMPDKKAHAPVWTRHCPLTLVYTNFSPRKKKCAAYKICINEIGNGSHEIIRSIVHQLFL